MYRAAAEEIVRSARAPLRTTEPEPLTVALEHGTISVKPDRVEGPDRLECQTFRRPPKDGKADPEQRHSLLREAAERHNRAGGEVVLHLRYLRSGESVPLSDKPKQRQKHLAAYDGALRGVRSGEFPAAPKDGDECPACPYFFICPA
uniref:PD-(D/E)XK endonuclease-like domain-containing protein n=1 Tax=uncultured Armatimonadetes bacterium TaxID=157466 RepID=A0A6J4IIH0_9BACT|nr:hypothetical protein AVDCRST_MAG63-2016 [uncultured Armatimonadetes bacterium]